MKRAQLFKYTKTFGVAAAISVAVLFLVVFYLGPEAAIIALLLMILEITFSFDNAVINARVLKHMSRFWQQMFLTVGIVIAVFGMRVIFPIVLVAVTAGLPMGDVFSLALDQPEKYSHHLEEAQPVIAAFGGMFLLLVCLAFFILENEDKKWLVPIEKAAKRLPQYWFTAPVLSLLLLLPLVAISNVEFWPVVSAGLAGIGLFIIMHGLIRYMQTRHFVSDNAKKAVKLTGIGGFVAFMYINVLDASFSFDGVIGAFAITSSVVLIAAGLGVGAVWVRSMTVYLVRHETLGKYVFLEQGAHYAIGMLAVVLLSGLFIHVPEVVTGLLGVSVIIWSVVSSRRKKQIVAKV